VILVILGRRAEMGGVGQVVLSWWRRCKQVGDVPAH